MNEIQTFTSEEFGSLRTIEIDGMIWFVGKDVAIALGYKNPQKAIRDHVDPEDKTVNESFTDAGGKLSRISALTGIDASTLRNYRLNRHVPSRERYEAVISAVAAEVLGGNG